MGKSKFRFEPVINFGTVITIASMILSVIAMWHKIDSTIQVHSIQIQEHETRLTNLEKRGPWAQLEPKNNDTANKN